MTPKHLKRLCRIGRRADALLRTAIARLKLSARAYHRVLKIARTIADVEGDGDIQSQHVAEAVQYRSLDRPVS
jgi:magnesium chelatase family protein